MTLEKFSNLFDDSKIKTGLNAATLIKKLENKGNIIQAELKQFYIEVKCFGNHLETFEKIPVSSRIVCNACIFNPFLVSATNVDALSKTVKILVDYFVDADWVDARVGEKMIKQFSLFLESSKTNFASLNRNNMKQYDEFILGKCLVKDSYPELANLIELIIVLFHGEAAVGTKLKHGKIFCYR